MASRFLDLLCSQCGSPIVRYRKVGSGGLLKLYLDRIEGPESILRLKETPQNEKLPNLTCVECKNLIGVNISQVTGNRRAYRLIKGAFRKRERR